MPDIRILSENLSNKIAAGEVVARPASVVKELLENAIDAKATNITLEVENGGRTLIRVSDNGTGMSRDNALLSIERFATSKIEKTEDLFSISTMGFRGEAIPSIAAVSKFSIITREKEKKTGSNIIISGGKLLNVTDTGAPPGTMVQVKNLFFNTPARKKFLKTYTTEMSHIADTFSSIALGNSGIGFRLFNAGKLVKTFASSDSLYERVIKVLGKDLSSNLLEVDCSENNIHVAGFVSSPMVTRSSSRMIKVFVNNRVVSDRGITSAIFSGYRGHLMKSRFPLAVLYVTLPFDNVDINVHPAKNEVRFFDGKSVYNVVLKAVKDGLAQTREGFYKEASASSPENKIVTEPSGFSAIPVRTHGSFKTSEKRSPEVVEESLFKYAGPDLSVKEDIQKTFQQSKETAVGRFAKDEMMVPQVLKSENLLDARGKFLIKGQVMSTYIVAETGDGMVLVDQHAAHERITYEKLKAGSKGKVVQAQILLMPETLELGFMEADLLTQILEDLAGYGFDIEPFGGTTFMVKSVPAIIDKKETAPFILEMIDSLIDKKTNALKNQWLEDALILMACHSSIRAKQNLNIQEMEQLLIDLEKCDNPLHCPHGRPTMIKWEKKDVEKMFKRIV
jgi:DNA mismatch repair protein MutL